MVSKETERIFWMGFAVLFLIIFIGVVIWVVSTGGEVLKSPCQLCVEKGFYCVKNTTMMVPLPW